eukprot:3854868-Rhodomonas_salina.3
MRSIRGTTRYPPGHVVAFGLGFRVFRCWSRGLRRGYADSLHVDSTQTGPTPYSLSRCETMIAEAECGV